MAVELKTVEEIEIMRAANLVVGKVLSCLAEAVRPGITTGELDRLASDLSAEFGVTPAFLNYPSHTPGVKPFPGVICASVNDEIVHGVPGPRVLKDGDIISIDYGCELDGFYGDSAVTVAVGTVGEQARRLMDVTKVSLDLAIEQCVPGNRIGDISNAVQTYVEGNGFHIVREFVGHGIGTSMHEPPQVPNFGRQGQGRLLKVGMVLAIEPMVTVTRCASRVEEDGWTASSCDGSLAAHFEHTVAITQHGPRVLSALDA